MIKPYYEEPNIKIYLGDTFEVLKILDDEIVTTVITSPPYKKEDGFCFKLAEQFGKNIKRLIRNDGLCFVNFESNRKDIWKSYNFAKIIDKYINLRDIIIWHKTNPIYYTGSRFLTNAFEFIFMFSKTNYWKFNRYAIAVNHEDTYKRKHKLRKRCRGNVWKFPVVIKNQFSRYLHQSMFNLELPKLCILLSSNKNDVILDPFLGSGTTLVACKELGRKGIGIEISQNYCDMAIQRLKGIN